MVSPFRSMTAKCPWAAFVGVSSLQASAVNVSQSPRYTATPLLSPVVSSSRLTSVRAVYANQTIGSVNPHEGSGAAGSSVAPSTASVRVNGSDLMTVAAAHSSFGGAAATTEGARSSAKRARTAKGAVIAVPVRPAPVGRAPDDPTTSSRRSSG